MKKTIYLLAFFATISFISCEKYNPNSTIPVSVINTSAGSNRGNIFTIAGTGEPEYSGDGGPAITAGLYSPSGVAIDYLGNLYIADNVNDCIRKVNSFGIISTIAGEAGDTTYYGNFWGDGGPAIKAGLFNPSSIATDHLGNIYIADYGNNRIRKVNANGIISTFAGDGTAGYSGDGIAATTTELFSPSGVWVDGSGNVYIADKNNNRIRKVNSSGIISTLAGIGTQGFAGDGGPATSAELFNPMGITMDDSGNLYIAEYGNNRIRKVNANGIISTFAGNGIGTYSGDNGPATAAELQNPTGIAIDGSGNVYIADKFNNIIRKVNSSGIITTFAGNSPNWGYGGDYGPATLAKLYLPSGVAIDSYGNVYIADKGNNCIRKVFN